MQNNLRNYAKIFASLHNLLNQSAKNQSIITAC